MSLPVPPGGPGTVQPSQQAGPVGAAEELGLLGRRAAESVGRRVESAASSASNTGQRVGEAASQGSESAGRAVVNTASRVSSAATGVGEGIGTGARDAAASAGTSVVNTATRVRAAATDVGEGIGRGARAAAASAGNTFTRTSSAVSGVTAPATRAFDNTAQRTIQGLAPARAAIRNTGRRINNATRQRAASANEAAIGTARNIRAAATSANQAIGRRATSATSAAIHTARNIRAATTSANQAARRRANSASSAAIGTARNIRAAASSANQAIGRRAASATSAAIGTIRNVRAALSPGRRPSAPQPPAAPAPSWDIFAQATQSIKSGVSSSPVVQKTLAALEPSEKGMPVDIMGDRYFLESGYNGAADINTKAQFENLYGIKPGDSVTIVTVFKVFKGLAPKDDAFIINRIKQLGVGELKHLHDAIRNRISSLNRTISILTRGSLIQSVALYKLDHIKKLYGWINTEYNARKAGTPAAPPTTTINYRTHYSQLIQDKKDAARKHSYMFESIMAVAYYLANPNFLIEEAGLTDTEKQAIIDKFEGVLELIDRGHLHDLVKSIREDTARPDELKYVKDLDAMNFLDRIRIKDVIEKPTFISASDEILREMRLYTMDEVMSKRVLSMIKVFQAKKYIDETSVRQIEGALRDKDTMTLMGSLGNAIKEVSDNVLPVMNASTKDTVQKLFQSFKPVYNFYKRVYDPVFKFMEDNVLDASDIDKFPLSDMTRLLNIGLGVYKRGDASDSLGVYKLLDVNSGVNDFIMKLQTASRLATMDEPTTTAFTQLQLDILADRRSVIGVSLTPRIRYLLYDQQFSIPNRADFEELLNEKVPKRRTTTNSGSAQFRALQDFFTKGTIYMFVNHRTDKQSTIFNPKVVAKDAGDKPSQSTELGYYKMLKQNLVIQEPIGPELRYVQLNIVLLAIACVIVFYKRLEKIST